MIRPFKPSTDFELLIQGETEAFNNSYPGEEMPFGFVTDRIRAIERGRTRCLVLHEDGVRGYVIGTTQRRQDIDEIDIESVYLLPAWRGQGLLDRLLRAMTQPSRRSRITLDVTLSNTAALDAYERLGFRQERVRMSRWFDASNR